MDEILLPGDEALDKPFRAEGTFVEDGKCIAAVVSLRRGDKVIPLKGFYVPRVEDYVVGVVSEQRFSGYTLDLNSPYEGTLSSRDTRAEFRQNDVVLARIISVDEVRQAVLGDARRLYGGRVIEVEPVKVPRIIGKNSSMVGMIREYCKSDVIVGKNGRLYAKGGDLGLVAMAVKKICNEAHLEGLTDRTKEFLEKESRQSPAGGEVVGQSV